MLYKCNTTKHNMFIQAGNMARTRCDNEACTRPAHDTNVSMQRQPATGTFAQHRCARPHESTIRAPRKQYRRAGKPQPQTGDAHNTHLGSTRGADQGKRWARTRSHSNASIRASERKPPPRHERTGRRGTMRTEAWGQPPAAQQLEKERPISQTGRVFNQCDDSTLW